MPKLKLEGWKFGIIAELLRERHQKELLTYKKILNDALGEDFDISNENDASCGVFETKRREAIAKHEQQRDIFKAKISLFEAEHRGATLTNAEQTEFAQLTRQMQAAQDIIDSIWDQFNLAGTIKNMALAAERKIDETDIIKIYDDAPGSLIDSDTDENSGDDDYPYPPSSNWGD